MVRSATGAAIADAVLSDGCVNFNAWVGSS